MNGFYQHWLHLVTLTGQTGAISGPQWWEPFVGGLIQGKKTNQFLMEFCVLPFNLIYVALHLSNVHSITSMYAMQTLQKSSEHLSKNKSNYQSTQAKIALVCYLCNIHASQMTCISAQLPITLTTYWSLWRLSTAKGSNMQGMLYRQSMTITQRKHGTHTM